MLTLHFTVECQPFIRLSWSHDLVDSTADGIDLLGNGIANSCAAFEPMLVEFGAMAEFPNARFVFRYSGSDPQLLTRIGTGIGAEYVPGDGSLRVWKKDGPNVRLPASADAGGDFIKPDIAYSPQQLGWPAGDSVLRLYLEAVENVADVSVPIDVEFYPLGLAHPDSKCHERVKVEIYTRNHENPPAVILD